MWQEKIPMKSVKEIEQEFPTLFEVLGSEYIEELKKEQGALAKRATINPFFRILYMGDELGIEECFSQAIKKKTISLDRLKRFRDEKKNVNIQNFINELHVLNPIFDNGKFLDETDVAVSPDFLAKIKGVDVVFECVSVNEAAESEKQRNLDTVARKKAQKEWEKQNPQGGVFSSFSEVAPFGTIQTNEIIEKIKKKKGSKQVKDYQYKILVMSFKNMSFLCRPIECLPSNGNLYDGIHSGFIFNAFYGKRGDLVFEGNRFDGARHKITRVKSDGKFIRDSSYNLCILHFETQPEERYKEYVFFENLNNPLPLELSNALCDKFNPYESYTILNKYVG